MQEFTNSGPDPLTATLAGCAALIALAFGLSTFDRWLRRRQGHELAWSVAMGLFSVGALALWWAESTRWGPISYRTFFLVGAVLNVAWLSLGTIYLLFGSDVGRRVRSWLVAASGFAVGVIVAAPTTVAISGHELPRGRDVFGVLPRMLVAIGSGVPALVIIAGALWSAWRILRRRNPAVAGHDRRVSSPGRLAAGNVLVAAGTLVLSASGSLAGRLGEDRAFSVTLLAGVVVLFVGFLVASGSTRRRSSEGAAQYLARAAGW